MMDWTDRHSPSFHRLVRRAASFCTEMMASAVMGLIYAEAQDHARSFRFRDQLWPNVQVGYRVGYLCINILEGRISFRSKFLAISYVRKGYVIGVSSSLQIVIDPKCHAVAFTKLHDHVVARIPNHVNNGGVMLLCAED